MNEEIDEIVGNMTIQELEEVIVEMPEHEKKEFFDALLWIAQSYRCTESQAWAISSAMEPALTRFAKKCLSSR